jgi:hypothetical protein
MEVNIPFITSKLQIPDQGTIPVIFFFNGTYNPIHKGHLHTLELAKEYLEKFDVTMWSGCKPQVLGAYISPCWGGYASRKLGGNR